MVGLEEGVVKVNFLEHELFLIGLFNIHTARDFLWAILLYIWMARCLEKCNLRSSSPSLEFDNVIYLVSIIRWGSLLKNNITGESYRSIVKDALSKSCVSEEAIPIEQQRCANYGSQKDFLSKQSSVAQDSRMAGLKMLTQRKYIEPMTGVAWRDSQEQKLTVAEKDTTEDS